MNKKEPLQGNVAQIINARELAINIGEDQGVKKGMIFAVLAATPLEIHDPNTNDLLDVLDREKVRVRATEVRSKITLCKTYRKKLLPGGPYYTGGFFANLVRTPQEAVETLKANDSSYPQPLAEKESYVKTGDRVVLVDSE